MSASSQSAEAARALCFALNEWQNAGAPVQDVVIAIANLIGAITAPPQQDKIP